MASITTTYFFWRLRLIRCVMLARSIRDGAGQDHRFDIVEQDIKAAADILDRAVRRLEEVAT